MTGPSSASLLRFKNEIGAGFELPGLKVVASPLKMPFLMALMPFSNGSPFAAVPLLSCCGPFQFGAPAFLYVGPPLMALEASLTLPDVLLLCQCPTRVQHQGQNDQLTRCAQLNA